MERYLRYAVQRFPGDVNMQCYFILLVHHRRGVEIPPEVWHAAAGVHGPRPRRRYVRHTEEEKRRIVQYAMRHSIYSAAKKFNVSTSYVWYLLKHWLPWRRGDVWEAKSKGVNLQ